MPEINLKTYTEAEQAMYGRQIPDYARLRRSNAEIYLTVDAEGMPKEKGGKLVFRVQGLQMVEYTAPAPEREKVVYDFGEVKLPKKKTVPVQVLPPENSEGCNKIGLAELEKKIAAKKKGISYHVGKELQALYARGYSYNAIGKILGITKIQVAAYINSNEVQKYIKPVLTLQMIERVREMWLLGALPQTIAEKLGYNYHCCCEFVLAYSEEIDSEPPTKNISNNFVVRIKALRENGATATEIAYKLKIPMFWVKRILE